MNPIKLHPKLLHVCLVLLAVFSVAGVSAAEATRFKPFILATGQAEGDIGTIVADVSKKLASNGFELVGQYTPYAGTTILVVSNDALRQNASQSELGAFGAVQRIAISQTKTGTQISYTNPTYMAYAYRMKSDLANVRRKLVAALGREADYGSERGLTKEELNDYQYKWLMPYFTDRNELAAYKNQQVALEKIEKTLKSKAGGAIKVYRVDLPGKAETVIGVNLTGPPDNECSGDQYIMSRIDFKKIKSGAHLPYEFVVSKGKVYALYAEFRIAISFPDLSMMGSNSFASIMCAPAAIKTALTKAVGGTENESDF